MRSMQSKEQYMKTSAYEKCPVCMGTGWEITQKAYPETYGDNRLIECVVKCTRCNGINVQQMEEAKKYADIPPAFYDADISKFNRSIYRNHDASVIDISKQMKVTDSFINNFPKWEKEGMGIYIYSNMKGSGKTFLASCICNSLIAKYAVRTKFVSASNLIELSKQSTNVEYYNNPIEKLCDCRILCIDDLGQKAGGFDWMQDILFKITDTRMQKKLVTIYTSNIKIDNLEFDDRIVDRINRTCLQISLPEYCVRAREANEKKKKFLAEIL